MSRRHSSPNDAPSRPPDLNFHFWDMLVMLAGEPAFEGLRESLSGGNGSRSTTEEVAALFQETWLEELLEAGPGGTLSAGTGRDAEGAGGDPGSGESQGSGLHSVGHWTIEALRLVERLGHPKIWRAYNTALLLFISFREESGWPSTWPIPGNQIRRFLMSLDSRAVSSAKIFMYLAGLSYISRLFNFRDPLQDMFTFRMMAGMRWQRQSPIPLSIEMLESLMEVLEEVCDSFYNCLLFRAVFSLSFFAALRPGQIVAVSCTSQRPHLLGVNDVEIQQDSNTINIHSAASGVGTFSIQMQQVKPVLCPILALQNYLAVRPRGDGPLFLRSCGHVLTREQFLIIFRAALRRLGLPSEPYSIQSFWLGSLTNAVKHHFSERTILSLARWPCRAILGSYGDL